MWKLRGNCLLLAVLADLIHFASALSVDGAAAGGLRQRSARSGRDHMDHLEASRKQKQQQGDGVPIMTGCLQLCGPDDQSCTTQCEVCVEMAKCESISDPACSDCAEQSDTWRRASKASEDWTTDGGGIPMVRDSTRTELQRAAFSERTGLHRFRLARRGVLQAQRHAEWALEERHEEAERLRESKEALKDAKAAMHKWDVENSKQLKELDAALAEKEEAVRILESQLEKVEKDGGPDQEKHAWELHQQLDVSKKALAKARLEKELYEDDAEWYESRLKAEKQAAEEDLKERLQLFKVTTQKEELSKKQLDAAKETYHVEAEALQEQNRKIASLEAQFHNYTLQLPISWRHREEGPSSKDGAAPVPHSGGSSPRLSIFFLLLWPFLVSCAA
mmetsp:Transcript_20171/g.47013  ORF Transcript_20171/g.47013 Transcript_20171/m.47013 type:complete len:391 (-) Transcript_20171:75-1247(-)